jgi:hypothetical protein
MDKKIKGHEDIEAASIDAALRLLNIFREDDRAIRDLYGARPDVFLAHVTKIIHAVIARQQQTNIQMNWVNYMREAEDMVSRKDVDKEKVINESKTILPTYEQIAEAKLKTDAQIRRKRNGAK